MKSRSMERCFGVNVPYHKRWRVMFPFKSGPLWYLRTSGCSCTKASLRFGERNLACEVFGLQDSKRMRRSKKE